MRRGTHDDLQKALDWLSRKAEAETATLHKESLLLARALAFFEWLEARPIAWRQAWEGDVREVIGEFLETYPESLLGPKMKARVEELLGEGSQEPEQAETPDQ